MGGHYLTVPVNSNSRSKRCHLIEKLFQKIMKKSHPGISVRNFRDHLPNWILIVRKISKGIFFVNQIPYL